MKKVSILAALILAVFLSVAPPVMGADKAISGLTEATSIADADLLMISYYSGGSFYSRKITFANFKNSFAGEDGTHYANIYNTTAHRISPNKGDQDIMGATPHGYFYDGSTWQQFCDTSSVCSGYQASLTKATYGDMNTGSNDTFYLTPAAIRQSYVAKKHIYWTVFDSDTDTATGDGKKGYAIPASMNGMNLADFTCSVYNLNSASGGTTTVVLRRSRAGTDQNMTSTGVTISYNEYTASDETINTSYDDVATGDLIFVDVDAVTTGAVQKGLSCTATFTLP
ncbi:MAG: hypothetical protein CVU54_01915 [Deltaproteobacteria bacterium HGW-Deltaproteobacteria-12]|jgi:hypothetical protein|nr:MAG: hypothetical protein CVU54_01915 [Deltaproteobacteria bacterium HGW-Deltaproteobacteria-12]